MKAIISSTYDDKYLYFLPIVTYCWNKLGVDVICFMPDFEWDSKENNKFNVVADCLVKKNLRCDFKTFIAPEHKQATYSQCSRLYAACLDLPEDEWLLTSDVDMAVLNMPYYIPTLPSGNNISIFGADLVPPNQYPICYLAGSVKAWRDCFDINGLSYQQCLDNLLSEIECDNMRGNYWGKDQEEAFNKISKYDHICINRAKEGTQFSTLRYDRDDSFILDRLSPDTIDFHMNRPGYEDRNFEIILTILKYHYPNEDFQWLIDYTQKYKELL